MSKCEGGKDEQLEVRVELGNAEARLNIFPRYKKDINEFHIQ